MTKTTPEKLSDGLEILTSVETNLAADLESLKELTSKIYSESSKLIDLYDDLPLSRMRKIKISIEKVLDSRVEFLDRLEDLQEVYDCFSSLVKDTNEFRRYYEDVYMKSVLDRQNRSSRDR